MLPPYKLGERTRRNPMDLIGFLRASGGMRPHGELNALGIGNAARDLEFARDEGFLGPMVRDDGMSLEEAAEAAWERGYFPDRDGPPSNAEFLDALDATNRGLGGRVFHPDDFEALDAYRAAQQERFRIEEAEQEGAPLHDDIGRPVTFDDLGAMAPPATAYEDLPSVGGRVANVNLANVETRGDIRRLLQATETRFGGFDAARRGKITQAETAALASELGMTADDLIKRRKGQALNAEQALAARQLLAKSSDEILKLAAKVDGGSDADVSAFQAAMVRHAAIYEQVTAATAEAGRTLAQFRIAARSREATAGRIHKAMLEGSGGRDQIEDVAAKILELQKLGATPGQVNKFAVKATKPRFSDKLVELWYNSLLSGPQTHVVNTVSNAMTAGLQIPEQLAASALGQFRRRSVDRVLASEIGPRVVGLTQGAREGLREFGRTLRTGEVRDHVTKVEARTQRAISGVKGEVIRIPTRLLAAEDELFKAMARRMEISGLAVRKARAEGLKGEALRNRIAELTANPTDEMFERSLDYARYLTYQRPLGSFGNAVSVATKNAPVLKLFLPFVRTPTNIFKFVIERSPAAPLLKEVRADLAAGGARRDLAAARMLLGTGFAMLISEMAADGRITGSGPLDDNAKSIKRADGWQPYSIRIGDMWISYQRLDPLATTMGVAADLVEKQSVMTEKQAENAAGLLIASIIKNLGDKTWFSGLSDLTAALDDPERSLTRVVGRVAGSAAVPALVAQTTRTADPVLREARTILDNVKARVPGLSQTLPAKRDIWGEAIVREGGIGPDFMSPMWTSTARNDPLNAEMLRLGAKFGAPSRTVGGRELTGHEYSNYLATSGQMTRNALAPLIASPEWRGMDREAQTKLVDRIKSDSRKAARRGLFGTSRKAAPPPPPPGFSVDPPPPGYVLD